MQGWTSRIFGMQVNYCLDVNCTFAYAVILMCLFNILQIKRLFYPISVLISKLIIVNIPSVMPNTELLFEFVLA